MGCSSLSPIVLFVYNRLEHTKKTIEALQKNHLSADSDLIIYSDAAKAHEDLEKVSLVRDFVKSIEGFKSTTVIERNQNWGLAPSIIDGVTNVVNKFGKIIVLEDDLVTSQYFLEYMNKALDFYEDSDDVVCVHGYVYPVSVKLPQSFFLKGADCWGWATWQRGWNVFESDGSRLLTEIQSRGLACCFDFNSNYPYTQMLQEQVAGKNSSWAIRWYASAFLKDKYTLYPGKSLVQNIGNDGSGTHCGSSDEFDIECFQGTFDLKKVEIEDCLYARQAFEHYFSSMGIGFFTRIKNRIARCLKRFLNA